MSGGVDSSVAFALLARSLGQENCYGLMVDQGLLRHEEGKLVKEAMMVNSMPAFVAILVKRISLILDQS